MSARSDRKPARLDRVALFTGAFGLLGHASMMVLDAALIATAAELVQRNGGADAPVLASALTGVVMLHLFVLAWCGRRVVEFLEVATDDTLPLFARRSKARRAARRAGTMLLLSGAMAPVVAILLLVIPAVGQSVGPFAGM